MVRKAKPKPIEAKPEEVTLKIEWNIPADIVTKFATNVVVQMLENEFKISFFEAKPEIVLGDETKLKAIKDRGTVRADCIGSFIVTADRMPNFINAMKNVFDVYESKQSHSPQKTVKEIATTLST